MALSDGYGVVIGNFVEYYRDPVNDYGQYFHGNIKLQTPAGEYRCAIDVDSHSMPNGVEWRAVELGKSKLKGVAELSDGWHSLEPNVASGAIDYIRSSELQPRLGCVFFRFDPFIEAILRLINKNLTPQWKQGTSIEALADLEPLLENPKKLYIFGEPFTYGGFGVHNIHQNQGDPAGSAWWNENGIWQDGITIVRRQDDSLVAFLNKFKTQSYKTDNAGHPI